VRHDEDLALSRRAAAGDAMAFRLLVEKHEAPLRAFLTHMVGAHHADDVAQDAFLKAWRAAGQFDGRSAYRTWLTRIAWRCRLDQLRADRPAEVAPDAAVANPAETAEVRDMLARLDDHERAALVLCDGHGWTHVEAAALLGVPLGTLKSTAARAKAKCRSMWKEATHD
jgi:RNA polymerase sigma-70 factor (ECF subfamily)